jgi:uncharacterized iron-regulated membrane protein
VLQAKTVRLWCRIHKWTSLVCTAFLLLLCVTGLPLIFHHEIEHLLGKAEPPVLAEEAPRASGDRIAAAAKAHRPGQVIQFMVWDPDEPDIVFVIMADAPDTPDEAAHTLTIDARTARVIDEPLEREGLLYILLKLHTDMFVGLPGKLFLGAMGLVFIVAVGSGVVVYGPFMRRLDFGAVRRTGTARLKWLDLHNLLGVVTVAWVVVVGATGVINTWADLVLQLWRADQLAAMTAPYHGKPAPRELASPERALTAAREAAPGMTPAFVAFPGTLFSSSHHYAVFMRGGTPLTARLLKPALIDAETSALTDTRELPWYVTALLVSQPLHFGDYGGMPMKIIWALLDVATIAVLGSGLYLWLARRRSPLEERLAALEPGA